MRIELEELFNNLILLQKVTLHPDFYYDINQNDFSFTELSRTWKFLECHNSTSYKALMQCLDDWNLNVNAYSSNISSSTGGTRFKAINQSLTHQVEGVLADQSRLRKRCQTLRTNYTIIGDTYNFNNDENDLEKNEDGNYGTEEKEDSNLNENIYDDNDFHQFLLREMIASKAERPSSLSSSDIGDETSDVYLRYMASKQNSNAPKRNNGKQKNRSMSKGRMISYDIIPKLANFMMSAPKSSFTKSKSDMVSWDDIQIDQLFNNLFRKQK